MIIKVWLKPNSQPREFEDVENTYVKGSFFCIFEKKLNQVTKYPISKIFRLQVLKAVQRYRKTNDMSIKIILETTQEPIVRELRRCFRGGHIALLFILLHFLTIVMEYAIV